MEIWKDIKGYEGIYQVSNLGNIKRLKIWCGNGTVEQYKKRERPLSCSVDNVGYYSATLSYKGKQYRKRVHRIVAETFLENPEEKRTVNHIDGNKNNNHLDNLEWATDSENMKHAHRIGIKKALKEGEHPSSKVVDQYSKKGDFIKRWESIRSVEIALKISNATICQCCKNNPKNHTAGGFVWKYARN